MSDFIIAVLKFAVVVFVEVFVSIVASVLGVLLFLGPIAGAYYLLRKAAAQFAKWDRAHLDGQVRKAYDEHVANGQEPAVAK